MHNGCVLVGDVGTGKTITALAYALLREPERDIYVITTAKKRDSGDWQREAALLAFPVDRIIVDSWNNIKHYHKINGAFFIFDEQRLVGTGAWVKTFYDIARKNHWVLLSATPGDTWLDYVPVFIANGFYKNITEFRQQHVVYARYSKYPKVERYLNPGLLQRRRKLILVEMPLIRTTKRHLKTVEVDYDKERFDRVWKKRWNIYEDSPIRDAGELFRVGRKVVNSDTSRLEALRQLLRVHPKLIVFYNFDYELEILRTLGERLNSPETMSNISDSTTVLSTSKMNLSDSRPNSKDQKATAAHATPAGRRGHNPVSSASESNVLISKEEISRQKSSVWNPLPSSTTLPLTRGAEENSNTSSNIQETETFSDIPLSTTDGPYKGQNESKHLWPEEDLSEHYLKRMAGTSTSTQSASRSPDRFVSSYPNSTIDTSCEEMELSEAEIEWLDKASIQSGIDLKEGGNTTAQQAKDVLSDFGTSTQSAPTVAEWNGHKHEPIPETDSWIYLVQYLAGSEGWNCIETDAMVFFSLTYSYKQFYQAQGRIDRLNTPFEDLWYYVLTANSIVDKAVLRSLEQKKDFNVRAFGF